MSIVSSISSAPCIACQAVNWQPCPAETAAARYQPPYKLVRCGNCGLRRLDPLPSQEELKAFYESDELKHQYIEHQECAYISGDLEALPYVTERLKTLQNFLGRPGRILDIGAAQGAFLKRAQEQGWEIDGLELSPEGVNKAQSHFGIKLRPCTLHEAAFPAQSFDAVHISHVMEHLPDPVGVLNEISRILRPDGLLAVEVPNEFDDLFDTLRTKLLNRPRTPYTVPSPHVYCFTPPTLNQVIKKSGFDVLHFETPRRNASFESKYPVGSLVRRSIFALEKQLKRGPLIEIYARKRSGS